MPDHRCGAAESRYPTSGMTTTLEIQAVYAASISSILRIPRCTDLLVVDNQASCHRDPSQLQTGPPPLDHQSKND